MKHDHKKTKKLKVALFAMIMFLPFIAIGVTCATHIFNKEVAEETQTAEIIYQYETEQPQENANLKNNYIYEYNIATHTQTPDSNLYVPTIIIYNQNTIELQYTTNITTQGIWIENTQTQINIKTEINGETIYTINTNNTNIQILVVYNENFQQEQSSTNTNLENWFNIAPQNLIPIENIEITTNPQDQTTNIFYDSCDQVQDSFVLNWCTNGNPIRNGINAFTNAFNLPNEHIINTLLTYWLCISMIYIVIDIIIECIVYITHFFNKEV